jgi:shikimate dehydrogenase
MKEFVDNAELIVNASSMGMKGKNDPPIRRDWLHSNQIVFDIVYDPPVTTLLRNARSAGAQTIDGLEMLLNQGAISFKLWTGKSAPITEMRLALSQKMMNYADS